MKKFPHNGNVFRQFSHTMERCFVMVFHGVEKVRAARSVRGWVARAAGAGGKDGGRGSDDLDWA